MPAAGGAGGTQFAGAQNRSGKRKPLTDPGGADAVLAAEREQLAASREFLRLMREHVLSLPAMAGDPLSEEFLKADLHRRSEALRDIPDTPLFFGRLDYAGDGPGTAPGADGGQAGAGGEAGHWGAAPGAGLGVAGERLHIGRRHVHDPQGRPVVIDWRAPVSRPFYRASPADPMGLERRRRFGFSGGELTAFEDEDLTAPPAAGAQVSRILIEEIERPRSGPMRDIVATIQPEQDDIVRADSGQSICVQGAPGTGKTAVGLHRVAYLLYAHQERMLRGGVLVVGPNRAFLSYIRGVLPALGELDVKQVTVADLAGLVPVRAADPVAAAQVKGDARMAEVLRRALWAGLAEPAEALVLVRGSRRWRLPAYHLSELIGELRARGVRYGAGRDLLGHRIAHAILSQLEEAGETCDDRTHDAVRRTRQVRAVVDAAWPKADPVRLVFRLLSDPALLATAADGILTAAEQAAAGWARLPRGRGSAPWTRADAVLVDEAADLIERAPSLAHVVVDEAQDLSAMECRALGRRCATGAATVLGDIAQATTPWAVASWSELLGHLGKQEAGLRVLATGYRVPRQILDFASGLLPHIAPGLAPARSLRQDPGALTIRRVPADGMASALAGACTDARARPGSVAVIAADDEVPELEAVLYRAGLPHGVLDTADPRAGLTLVPVTLAKGLEYDHVIVVEPAHIAAAEARGLHRLYVALTRAVSRLTVLHAEPLPAPLR
jgi:DNA helicase IV